MDRANIDLRSILLVLFFEKLKERADLLADFMWIYALMGGNPVDEGERFAYAQHRWYDPETAQFISEDPIKDGTNYYAYCGNNPTTMIDPDGNWFGIDDLIVVFAGINQVWQNGGDNYGEVIGNYFKQYYAASGEVLLNFTGLNIAVSAYNASSPNFKGNKTLGYNYWVGDMYDMINQTMEYLKSDIRVLSANKDNADFSVVKYKTLFKSNSYHFVAGDKLGAVSFDPDPSLKENYKLKISETYYFRWSE